MAIPTPQGLQSLSQVGRSGAAALDAPGAPLTPGNVSDFNAAQPEPGGLAGPLASQSDVEKAFRQNPLAAAEMIGKQQKVSSSGELAFWDNTGSVSFFPPVEENINKLLSAGLVPVSNDDWNNYKIKITGGKKPLINKGEALFTNGSEMLAIPVNNMEMAYEQGLKPVSALDYAARKHEEQYKSVYEKIPGEDEIGAFISGGLSTITGGLSDRMNPEQIESAKKEHPYLRLGGEVAGFAVPVGPLMGVGSKITGGVTGALSRGATSAITRVAEKAVGVELPKFSKLAAEGFGAGIGIGIQEIVSRGIPDSLEEAQREAENFGLGVALSGVIPPALFGVGALVKGIKYVGEKAATGISNIASRRAEVKLSDTIKSLNKIKEDNAEVISSLSKKYPGIEKPLKDYAKYVKKEVSLTSARDAYIKESNKITDITKGAAEDFYTELVNKTNEKLSTINNEKEILLKNMIDIFSGSIDKNTEIYRVQRDLAVANFLGYDPIKIQNLTKKWNSITDGNIVPPLSKYLKSVTDISNRVVASSAEIEKIKLARLEQISGIINPLLVGGGIGSIAGGIGGIGTLGSVVIGFLSGIVTGAGASTVPGKILAKSTYWGLKVLDVATDYGLKKPIQHPQIEMNTAVANYFYNLVDYQDPEVEHDTTQAYLTSAGVPVDVASQLAEYDAKRLVMLQAEKAKIVDESDRRYFNSIVSASTYPAGMLNRIANHSYTSGDIYVLENLFPDIYAKLVAGLNEIDYKDLGIKDKQLYDKLNVGTRTIQLQSAFGAQGQPGQQALKAQKIKVNSKRYMTDTESAENNLRGK